MKKKIVNILIAAVILLGVGITICKIPIGGATQVASIPVGGTSSEVAYIPVGGTLVAGIPVGGMVVSPTTYDA